MIRADLNACGSCAFNVLTVLIICLKCAVCGLDEDCHDASFGKRLPVNISLPVGDIYHDRVTHAGVTSKGFGKRGESHVVELNMAVKINRPLIIHIHQKMSELFLPPRLSMSLES